MKLAKFLVLSSKDELPSKYAVSPILINLDHIVSVRPINIRVSGDLIKGHWIRLVNGKKYRAIEIPTEISTLFQKEELLENFNSDHTASIHSSLEGQLH